MVIQKRGKKVVLKSKKTGKVLGKHQSVKKAKKQETAIMLSKLRKKRGRR